MSFVFDIDVIKQSSATLLEANNVSEHLRTMRQAKNTIFFGNLTEKALQPYK